MIQQNLRTIFYFSNLLGPVGATVVLDGAGVPDAEKLIYNKFSQILTNLNFWIQFE